MPLFQDGLTAHTYEADLYPEDTRVRIVYQDRIGNLQNLFWDIDSITPEEFPGEQPRLHYGRLSQQSLQFESRAALAAFQKAFPGRTFIRTGIEGWKIWQHQSGMAVGIGLLMAGIVWMFMFGLPSLADRFAQTMPQAWEEAIGRKMAAGIQVDKTTLPKTSALAQQFFRECGYQTRYPIRVVVTESRTVNAFAVPGGTIVVYSGLLEKATRPEQLASLLGHELGHVEERHSLRLMCRSLATYILFSALMGDIAGISAVVVDNGQQLQQMNYSRELESSADDFSIAQMRRRKLDVAGMDELFAVLQEESEGAGVKMPQFMSSHPLTSERRRKAVQAAAIQRDEQPNPRLIATFARLKASLAKEGSGVL